MNVTVPIYQRRQGNWLGWSTIGLGPLNRSESGRNATKVQRALIDKLRAAIGETPPSELHWLEMQRGIKLERVRLELTLRSDQGKRKFTGNFPLILEPRWFDDEHQLTIVFHPDRQSEWFPRDPDLPLPDQAAQYLGSAWAELTEETLEGLVTNRKDRIKSISFTATTKSLLDQLPDRQKGIWDDLEPEKKDKQKGHRGTKVLSEVGVDLTPRAASGALPLGTSRQPYRQQLQQLLSGRYRSPVLVVGPAGSGKTTLIHRWIRDQLTADDYDTHRNLDRCHHVWAVSGRRLIAGMSLLGQWEQRCVDLLAEVVGHKRILYVDDIHAWPRIGRSRDSDRNIAELFRGPLSRGDLQIVGECTPEQLASLEQEAPALAARFARVTVEPTSPAETMRMLVQRARALELGAKVCFSPLTFRALLELAAALLSQQTLPGKVLDLLDELAKHAERLGDKRDDQRIELDPRALIQLLSEKTGLPAQLIEPEQTIDPDELSRRFSRHIIGQPAAVEAATDLICRIRAGLTDPRRPYGVYLITGPTGTGKTELAKCIADYLYGDRERMLRFDMSELSGPDATARLIGDRYEPRGLLTSAIRQQPFSLVLLDEIEKAHPSVFNLLLQVLDEGRLTDAAGERADLTHAVILMTSNLGARGQRSVGFTEDETAIASEVMRAIEAFFSPELLNRFDRIVRFSPLSREAARLIGKKELSKLLGRWGLIERNVFVHVGARPLERIVAEAFDPLYGARTVKRYLEEHVGSLLSEALTCDARAARMRTMRLYERDGRLLLHQEALTSAAAEPASYAIAPLLDEPPRALQARLPEVMDELDALLGSDELSSISQEISRHLELLNQGLEGHADAIYQLEQLRGQLKHLRGRIGYQLARKDPRADEILACLAEVPFYRRALTLVSDPTQHVVHLAICRLGLPRDARSPRDPRIDLVATYCRACHGAGAGELEQVAATIGEEHASLETPDATALDRLLARSPSKLVLKLVGLSIREYYRGETGCHLWRSTAHGTDLLRVELLGNANPGQSAADALAAQQATAGAFVDALERGDGPLPENPEGLIPTVREIDYAPSTTGPGPQHRLSVDDFQLGFSGTLALGGVEQALRWLWTLRMSRNN